MKLYEIKGIYENLKLRGGLPQAIEALGAAIEIIDAIKPQKLAWFAVGYIVCDGDTIRVTFNDKVYSVTHCGTPRFVPSVSIVQTPSGSIELVPDYKDSHASY